MIVEQTEKLNRVIDNITNCNEVVDLLIERLLKSGANENDLKQLVYVLETKGDFRIKKADIEGSLRILHIARDLNKELKA